MPTSWAEHRVCRTCGHIDGHGVGVPFHRVCPSCGAQGEGWSVFGSIRARYHGFLWRKREIHPDDAAFVAGIAPEQAETPEAERDV